MKKKIDKQIIKSLAVLYIFIGMITLYAIFRGYVLPFMAAYIFFFILGPLFYAIAKLIDTVPNVIMSIAFIWLVTCMVLLGLLTFLAKKFEILYQIITWTF